MPVAGTPNEHGAESSGPVGASRGPLSGARVTLMTAHNPGAVAIVLLTGDSALPLISQLTGVSDWPLRRVKLVRLGDIDRAMVVRLGQDWVQITPHGGVWVVSKLIDRLVAMGAAYDHRPPSRVAFPEAANGLEADMLACLASATSPAAVDLLTAQPSRWRGWLDRWKRLPVESLPAPESPQQILAASDRLDKLVSPPLVVVVGRPNVGKSTLTNRLLGRSASLVADLPGTTRDWVSGLAVLEGVAVRWVDTPGLRDDTEQIEQRAIELAARVIDQADLLIALCDRQTDWPLRSALGGRDPGLWAVNKIDLRQDGRGAGGDGVEADAPLGLSATTGQGLERFQRAVVGRLGLGQLDRHRLWAFSPPLRVALTSQRLDGLGDYIGS